MLPQRSQGFVFLKNAVESPCATEQGKGGEADSATKPADGEGHGPLGPHCVLPLRVETRVGTRLHLPDALPLRVLGRAATGAVRALPLLFRANHIRSSRN